MIETVLEPPPPPKKNPKNKTKKPKTIWLQQVQMGTLLVHPL